MLLKEIVSKAAASLGNSLRLVRLPAKPIFLIASFIERIFKTVNLKPPIHPRRVAFFTKDRSFNTEKMTRLTGFRSKVVLRRGAKTLHQNGIKSTVGFHRAKKT